MSEGGKVFALVKLKLKPPLPNRKEGRERGRKEEREGGRKRGKEMRVVSGYDCNLIISKEYKICSLFQQKLKHSHSHNTYSILICLIFIRILRFLNIVGEKVPYITTVNIDTLNIVLC